MPLEDRNFVIAMKEANKNYRSCVYTKPWLFSGLLNKNLIHACLFINVFVIKLKRIAFKCIKKCPFQNLYIFSFRWIDTLDSCLMFIDSYLLSADYILKSNLSLQTQKNYTK